MFEKIGRLAERAAANVGESRRGFLGRLGAGALAAVALLGGVFVSPAAGQGPGFVVCCRYLCNDRSGRYFYTVCQAAGTKCSGSDRYCRFSRKFHASSCAGCV